MHIYLYLGTTLGGMHTTDFVASDGKIIVTVLFIVSRDINEWLGTQQKA